MIRIMKSMESKLILSKESSKSQLRAYFTGVMGLYKSNEAYPVDLDDVWPLVYGKKSDAVEALKRDFMQTVDYQVLRQNPQNPLGGRPVEEYHITVECMEFFIARKVRPVFDVYREVFKKVATGEVKVLPSYQIDDPIKRAEKWIEEQKERQMLEAKNAEMRPKADYFDRLVDRNLLTNIRDTAKQIGLQQNAFVKLLLGGKFLYRDAKGCLKPFAAYADKYFRLKDFERNGHTSSQVLVTPEGKEAFALLFGKF